MLSAHRSCFAIALLWTPAAQATQWYTGATPKEASDWIVSSDTSLTVGSSGSVFGASTATIAVTDTLRDSGFRARLQGVGGRYEYTGSAGHTIVGRQAEGSVLGGYEWLGSNASVAGYLGFLARDNTLSIPDPGNRVIGTALGVKAVLEAYASPTENTMVAAYGSYATAYNAYFGRLKFGYDVGGHVFVGPEFTALGDDFFRQWRIGAHATGFRIGAVELALSAGVVADNRKGTGAYTTIDARVGF